MIKIVTFVGVVLALALQAEPKFDDLLAKAKAGDAEAMRGVARCYSYGIGVLHNKDLSAEWTLKAASNGCIRAIGICHEMGYGTREDVVEAMKWYRKAAEQGDVAAMDRLGQCTEKRVDSQRNSDEDKTNAVEAVRWYRKAAELGCARAMWHLGECYRSGRGVGKNAKTSAKWCRKSAETGDALAMWRLSWEYQYSAERRRIVERNLPEALKWTHRSAEEGCILAMKGLATFYEFGGIFEAREDPVEAVKWYRKLADLGDVNAMESLGFLHYKGLGVKKNDADAVKWFRQAVGLGHALARKNLGWMYKHGLCSAEEAAVASNRDTRCKDCVYGHEWHNLELGWRYEAAKWCLRRFSPQYGFREMTSWEEWFQEVLICQYRTFLCGKTLSQLGLRVLVSLSMVLVAILFCLDWSVRMFQWLMKVKGKACDERSEGDRGRDALSRKMRNGGIGIENRWWRLYAVAPFSVKFAVAETVELTMLLAYLVTELNWGANDGVCDLVGFVLVIVLEWFLLRKVVRGGSGRISRISRCDCLNKPSTKTILVVLTVGLWIKFCFVLSEILDSSPRRLSFWPYPSDFCLELLFGSFLGVLFSIPFFLPSTRRWARAYREAKAEFAAKAENCK